MDDDNTFKFADGTELSYETVVEFECEFCGKRAQLVNIEELGYSATHDRPECPEFTAMDAHIFLQENRRIRQEREKDPKLKLVN